MATNNNSNKKKQATKTPTKSSTNPKETKKIVKSNPKSWKTILKRIFFTCLFLGLALFVVGLGYVFAIIKSTPPLDINSVLLLNQPTLIYDRDGALMDNWHTDEERFVIGSDEIPDNLKNAFVSIEDQRFYSHSGIDVKRIAGAFVTDVVKILKGKSGMHGGSTLTQQLLKNTILSDEDFIIERKIKEIYLALKLEKELSKDQILTQYLNTIPLGGTVYGVESASMLYFGKPAIDLSLIECAYLAGITQAPTTYSAYNIKNQDDPSVYLNRTKTVLGKMFELGKISEEEYNQAIIDVDNNGLVFKPSKKNYNLNYEWFVNPAVAEVKKDLQDKYKYTDEELSKLMMNGGLKIYTTMDRGLQDHTQSVLDNLDSRKVGGNGAVLENTNTPALQASATVTDYKTGEVLALVGGRGEQGANSRNRAYSDLRSLGSSIKPLTVYGPAINEKIVTAGSSVDDAPVTTLGSWSPENVTKTFDGNISIRDAITYSKNTAAALTANSLGINTAISYGEKLGLIFNDKSKSLPSIALGQFDNANGSDGGNTYISASAFGTFGNNGVYVEPKLYSKVVDASGKTLLENETITKTVFSSQTAYIMYDLLKGPVKYYGAGDAQFGSMPVAGKTGTSSDAKDFWFSGLTPYLSGSVWVGYDMQNEMSGTSSVAAELWGDIMSKAHEGKEVTEITMPDGIVKASVCKDSGKTPTALCSADPRGNRVSSEYFIAGTEPTSLCESHVMAKINTSNNKLATDKTPKGLIAEKVFVKKSVVSSVTKDFPYLLPTETDDTVEVVEPEKEEEDDKDDETTPGTPGNPSTGPGNKPNDNKPDTKPDNKPTKPN